MRKLLLLTLILAPSLFAQTSKTGLVQMTADHSTVTCAHIGDLYYQTGGTPNLYGCAAASGNPSVIGSGGGGAVSSVSGDGTIITNSASTGAVTLTIAGTSGGIPYFSSSSGWASSAALTVSHILLGGGAGSAPTADSKLDDGATTSNTLTYTGTGGIVASGGPITAGGTGAGAIIMPQGSALGHAGTTQITLEAPASVTSYEIVLPGSSATGFWLGTDSSGVNTITNVAPAAGKVLNNSTFTYTPALGVDNSSAGTIQLSNGSANAHTIIASGATTTNTIKGFTVAPTTTDLIACTTASTTCTLTDSGIADTASGFNGVIQGLTGCTTATYVYTPQASDCVAPGAASPVTQAFVGEMASNYVGGYSGIYGNNAINLFPMVLPNGATFSHILFDVYAADATHNSDIGIYGPNCAAGGSCPLVTHITGTTYSSTGPISAPLSGAPVSLAAGNYWVATTSAVQTWAVTTVGYQANATLPFSTGTGTATTATSGNLPSTITLSSAGATLSTAYIPYAMFY